MDHDAIVIGSGFGGAVAAARLAQAGVDVAVLERGRRWRPGDFPRDERDLGDRWLWAKDGGLFDLRWLDRMLSVQGAGWGGGSLVYANVFARPSADTFRDAWPAELTRAELDPYFDLAAHMLEVAPIGVDPATGRPPQRTRAMERLVDGMGLAAGTVRPNLAVRFAEDGADPQHPIPNRHGVVQRACTFCGECVIGCDHGAKNSLDHNYLAVAERAGATVVTGAEVTDLARIDGGYEVRVRSHPHGGSDAAPEVLRAPEVFLAAGAVGTTELLLRARERGLRALSPRLGDGFSGNGDFLSFISRTRTPLQATHGPTITTTTIVDFDEADEHVWFQVQDGAFPAVLSRLLRNVLAPMPRRRRSSDREPPMALLLMGRDTSTGRIVLDGKGEAMLDWDNRANSRLYRAEALVGRVVARALRGRARVLPTWSLMRRAITVHPLGGVPMGVDREHGVVDSWGGVHGYPGLHVVDGAAVPSATGANPSASIAALAERSIERAVRRITGDAGWRAPEWDDVRPVPAPEDQAMQRMAERRRRRSGDGVRFRERMTGRIDGRRAVLQLSAEIDGWKPFLADRTHPVRISGTVDIDGIATRRPVAGVLQLFPERGDVAMRYRLSGRGDDGAPMMLVGTKRRGAPLRAARDLTTLRLRVQHGSGSPARGILRIGPVALVRLLASVRGVAFTRGKRVAAAARFLRFFAARAVSAPGRPAPPARRSLQHETGASERRVMLQRPSHSSGGWCARGSYGSVRSRAHRPRRHPAGLA